MIDLTELDNKTIARIAEKVKQLKDVETLEEVNQMLDGKRPAPRAYVLLGGFNFGAPTLSGYQTGSIECAVYIIARNVGGKGRARKNNDGVYALAQNTIAALNGFNALPCMHWYISGGRIWKADQHSAIYELRFKANLSEDD